MKACACSMSMLLLFRIVPLFNSLYVQVSPNWRTHLDVASTSNKTFVILLPNLAYSAGSLAPDVLPAHDHVSKRRYSFLTINLYYLIHIILLAIPITRWSILQSSPSRRRG